MNDQRTTLYSFSFAHHGRYSSMHRLMHYSSDCRRVDVSVPWLKGLGATWRNRVEYRWFKANEWRLRPIFYRSDKQCVHYIHPENTLFRAAEWKGGHGLVLTCHQAASDFPGRNSDRFTGYYRGLEAADKIVLLTSSFAPEYAKLCGPERLVVIPHGVDVHFFQPATNSPPTPLVLSLGNWLRDYDLWAQVASRVAERNPNVTFAVVVAAKAAEAIHRKFGGPLAQRVRFLNGLSDEQLRDLYQQATAVFLPLKAAGANNALVESLASGLPLLVTDLPATREYAGDCAVYFTPANADECCFKLEQLLENSQLRATLAEKGRQHAVQTLAWERIAEQHARLYADVLAS